MFCINSTWNFKSVDIYDIWIVLIIIVPLMENLYTHFEKSSSIGYVLCNYLSDVWDWSVNGRLIISEDRLCTNSEWELDNICNEKEQLFVSCTFNKKVFYWLNNSSSSCTSYKAFEKI